MDDYGLSRNELIIAAVAAFIVIVIPGWIAASRNRRAARLVGYRPQGRGFSSLAVLAALIPITGVLFIWFLASAGLIGMMHEQIPPKVMGGMPWMLGLADLTVLVVCMHLFLPVAYMNHVRDTPKGMHGPLDWLFGLVISVVFFPAAAIQILYVVGLGSE